jgi:hypothetical protein
MLRSPQSMNDCLAEVAPRHERSIAPRGAHVASDLSDDVGLQQHSCHLCESGILPGAPCKTFKGFSLHIQCMNAVRCSRRLLAKDPNSLNDSDKKMIQDPPAWRADVSPLIATSAKGRNAAARTVCKQRTVVKENYQDDAVLDDYLHLTKNRYKAYKCFWDRCGSETASEDFDAALTSQNAEFSKDGEDLVRVQDNMRDRSGRGVKSATIDHSDIPDPLPASAAGDLLFRRREREGDRQGTGRERDRQGRGRERDRRPAVQDRRSSTPGLERGVGSIGRDGVRQLFQGSKCELNSTAGDNLSEADAGSRRGSPSKFQTSRAAGSGLTERALSLHNSQSKDEEEPAVTSSAKRAKSLSAGGGEPTSGKKRRTGRISPVEFMEERAKLKNRLVHAKDKESSSAKGSVLSKIRIAVSKLSDAELKQLDKNPQEAVQQIELAVQDVCTLLDELDGLRSSGLIQQQTKVQGALQKLEDALDAAEAELEAMTFLIKQGAKLSLREANHVRYARTKMNNKMQTGGFSKGFAKQVLFRCETPDTLTTNPETFVAGDPLMWLPEEGSESAFTNEYNLFRTKVTNFDDKAKVLKGSLEDKPKWKGAMVRLDVEAHDMKKLGVFGDEKLVKAEHQGSAPWLMAFRLYSWRYGPFAWPMPGFGCFVQLRGGTPEMHLLLVKASNLLQEGIAIKDLQSFFETQTGQACFRDHAKVVKLMPAAVVWIPFGFLAIPLAMAAGDLDYDKAKDTENKDQEMEKDKDKDKDTDDMGYLWCWTPFVPKWASDVDTIVWNAISGWNSEHIAKNLAMDIWQDRKTVFTDFAAQVERC